jgi:hypothetical protein
MNPACDHQPTIECCRHCCRKCVLDEQLDERASVEPEHPFFGRQWPTYHRMIEKPARLRGSLPLHAEPATFPASI